LRYSTLKVSIKLWQGEQNEIGLCLISISLKRRRYIREDEKNEQDDGQQGKH